MVLRSKTYALSRSFSYSGKSTSDTNATRSPSPLITGLAQFPWVTPARSKLTRVVVVDGEHLHVVALELVGE